MRRGGGEEARGKREAGLQMNELMLRYTPCGRTGLLEHKWILTLQSLKLAEGLRLQGVKGVVIRERFYGHLFFSACLPRRR